MEQLFCGKLHRQWWQVASHPALRATFSLRAKSRFQRLRSDTRLRTQPLGKGFLKRGTSCLNYT